MIRKRACLCSLFVIIEHSHFAAKCLFVSALWARLRCFSVERISVAYSNKSSLHFLFISVFVLEMEIGNQHAKREKETFVIILWPKRINSLQKWFLGNLKDGANFFWIFFYSLRVFHYFAQVNEKPLDKKKRNKSSTLESWNNSKELAGVQILVKFSIDRTYWIQSSFAFNKNKKKLKWKKIQ